VSENPQAMELDFGSLKIRPEIQSTTTAITEEETTAKHLSSG